MPVETVWNHLFRIASGFPEPRCLEPRCHCPMAIDCRRPGKQRDFATFDHIIPLARGGSNLRANRVLACRDCNEMKGDMTVLAFFRATIVFSDMKTSAYFEHAALRVGCP
jgi:hypothetical protein